MQPRPRSLPAVLAGGALSAALGIAAMSGCGSSSTPSPARPTPAAPSVPAVAAFIGRAKAVSTGPGASAQVTLDHVRYVRVPGQGSDLVVVDVTLVGTSVRAFPYSSAAFVFGYSDDSNLYAHTQDGNLYGPSANEDYTPYAPPGPLGDGQLRRGQSIHGLVILRVDAHSDWDLILTPTNSAETLAEWSLASQ